MSLGNYPDFLLNFSVSEMSIEEKHFYQFKSFRLNAAERQLLNNGVAVPLAPKIFDVLVVLVERSGHLVEKDELLRIVWSDSFVEEANIARIVHTLRKVLGEDENGNKFIETVAKKGYRFVAEVDEIRESAAPKPNSRQSAAAVGSQNGKDEQLPPAFRQPPTEISPPVVKPKQKTRLILFAVGFLSVISLLLLLSFNFQSESSFNPNEIKSIAVLPLKPLTAENRNAGYELGIADSLIFKLSSAKNLVVRPFEATQQYVDVKMNPIAIGKEQKVDFVLASNYQIADGKIRITSQLLNVANGAIEEVFQDEQNISNIFAVQDAVAANISRKLLAKSNRQSNNLTAKRYTNNEEAYRLYWQGRVLTDKRNKKDSEKAIEYLEQAVRLDPNYALAYAQLANTYGMISMQSSGDQPELYLKQKAAVEKALTIDDNLAEAHAQLGIMKSNYERDFAGAERELKKGIELDAKSATAHRLYAIYLNSMGRFDESIAEIKIATDIEPASATSQKDYGMILFYARRYDEAIPLLERTIEMNPNLRQTYGWLINSYQMKGSDDKAFEWFLRRSELEKTDSPEKIQLWKEIYAKSGWRGIHERRLEEAKEEEKNGKPSYWTLTNLYTELGDKEQTLFYLEKRFALGDRGWGWTTIKIDPRHDFLRSDPRFEDLVRRVGLK